MSQSSVCHGFINSTFIGKNWLAVDGMNDYAVLTNTHKQNTGNIH